MSVFRSLQKFFMQQYEDLSRMCASVLHIYISAVDLSGLFLRYILPFTQAEAAQL
jgi:hypothetical protein